MTPFCRMMPTGRVWHAYNLVRIVNPQRFALAAASRKRAKMTGIDFLNAVHKLNSRPEKVYVIFRRLRLSRTRDY